MMSPPVILEPLEGAARSAGLGGARRRFLRSVIGDAPVFYVQRSDTTVDVGSWLRKAPVCVCLLERELLLFATGRRPYAERIPLWELQDSEYNHVTGEVILAPAEAARVKRLKMSPLAGRELLSYLASAAASGATG